MSIKIRYQYKVYQGCDEATEKSKNWECTKSLGWSVWLCLGFGTLCGANAISQLITNTYDAEMFWPMVIFLLLLCLLLIHMYSVANMCTLPVKNFSSNREKRKKTKKKLI